MQELKSKYETLDKSKMVLKIKFESALAENDDLRKENEILDGKVSDLASNISNAESRSESVSFAQNIQLF